MSKGKFIKKLKYGERYCVKHDVLFCWFTDECHKCNEDLQRVNELDRLSEEMFGKQE